jgi:hypothetical protein
VLLLLLILIILVNQQIILLLLCCKILLNGSLLQLHLRVPFFLVLRSKIPKPPPSTSADAFSSPSMKLANLSAPAIKALKSSVSSPGKKNKNSQSSEGFFNWLVSCYSRLSLFLPSV